VTTKTEQKLAFERERERERLFDFVEKERKAAAETALARSLEKREKGLFFLTKKTKSPVFSPLSHSSLLPTQNKRVRNTEKQKAEKVSFLFFYALGLLSLSPPPPNLGRLNSRILRFSLERTRTTLEWIAAEMQ